MKTKKISISVDGAELAWMEKYAKDHDLSLSYLFTSAARLFRHFTVDQPAQVEAAMKGCGNPSHYAAEPTKNFSESPSPSETWDLTNEERLAFLLIAEAVPAGGGLLDDLVTEHETRDLFRRACEKLLARADSRRVMTTAERELEYLKGRIHDAKGWLKLGLTHELWGSIKDGYAALDNGRVPPVKTWQAEGAKKSAKKHAPEKPLSAHWAAMFENPKMAKALKKHAKRVKP